MKHIILFLFFFPLYFARIKCNRRVASEVCHDFFTCCLAKQKELIQLNCPLCLLDYDCRLGCGSSCTHLQHQLFNHTTAFLHSFVNGIINNQRKSGTAAAQWWATTVIACHKKLIKLWNCYFLPTLPFLGGEHWEICYWWLRSKLICIKNPYILIHASSNLEQCVRKEEHFNQTNNITITVATV